jgi:hypothetical protein
LQTQPEEVDAPEKWQTRGIEESQFGRPTSGESRTIAKPRRSASDRREVVEFGREVPRR